MNSVLYAMGYKEPFSVIQVTSSPHLLAVFGVFGLIVFIYCYGAAKLSYDYNMSINNQGYIFMWAFLCYIFAFIYYPYYAIFLNPVASLAAPMVGGKRRMR